MMTSKDGPARMEIR
jgi:hypothetical protein